MTRVLATAAIPRVGQEAVAGIGPTVRAGRE